MIKHTLELERQSFTNKSTIGTFYFDGDFHCYSLELPWRANKRGVSCIPAGTYDLVPHKFRGRYDTFALVGNGVTHYDTPESLRSTIVIHVGNKPSEIDGCILAGTEKHLDELWHSGDAILALVDKIKHLNITSISII